MKYLSLNRYTRKSMILKMKMNFGQYLMTMLMVVFVYACGDGSANHEGDAVEQEVE